MIKYQDRWAMVTGASSGLGRGLAARLGERGMSLVLTGPQPGSVGRDGGTNPSRYAASDGRNRRCGSVDAIGCVGAAQPCRRPADRGARQQRRVRQLRSICRREPAHEDDEIAVDVSAVVTLARAFLPGMIARRSGGILNVASAIAFQPAPYQAVYGASKAFVLLFSHALWAEARAAGVTVTALCPGPTRTGFVDALGADVAHTAIYSGSLTGARDRGRAVGPRQAAGPWSSPACGTSCSPPTPGSCRASGWRGSARDCSARPIPRPGRRSWSTTRS